MRPPISTARRTALLIGALLVFQVAASRASVDDAQSFALQAAEPYVKEGFQVREDYWGGDLGVGEKKAVRQQFFKGNEYWFWMGTEVEQAKVSVHVYDADGKLVRATRQLAKGSFRRGARDSKDDRQLFYHCGGGEFAGGADPLGAGLRIPVGTPLPGIGRARLPLCHFESLPKV